MSKPTFRTIALIAALAVLAVTGCGSSDDGKSIPARIRNQLQVQLEEAQARLDNGSAGACEDITKDTEPDVDRILDRVPADVDPDVRDALNEGFARLFELVSNRCEDLQDRQRKTQPDTTEKSQPPEPETTPPETETPPTTPSETETTPEQPTTPDTGNGNGNGNGGGNGNGNGNGDGGTDGDGAEAPGDDGGGATSPGA